MMRQVIDNPASLPTSMPTTIVLNHSDSPFEAHDKLADGVLLAQDQQGRAYILEIDQTTGTGYSDDANGHQVIGQKLAWHQLGACRVVDDGKAFEVRFAAVRWALDQGWWVWHTKDGDEAQRWIGQQLREQSEKQAAKGVAMV